MSYMIYKALDEYKQVIGYDNFKSVIQPDEFRSWLYSEYGVLWHQGNPDYINFQNKEYETAFKLRFS